MKTRPFTLHGITFNEVEEAFGSFDCFDGEKPQGTDLGPSGMVAEARTFVETIERLDLKSFCDVGALFGIYSFLFTARPGTRARAIEASPWAFPILEQMVAANHDKRVMPLNAFMGETDGRRVPCARDWKHVVGNRGTEGETYAAVERKIDQLVFRDLDCMKIDVEGYECQVLRGAQRLIARCKPVIFLEVHVNDLAQNGETAESLEAIISGMGYKSRNYDGSPAAPFRECSMTRVICWPEGSKVGT